MQELGVVIAATGLAVVVLSSVGGLVWRLSRIEIGLRAEYTKEVGLLASKVYDFEIWSRDEFVRKSSFEASISRMERGFDTLRGEITTRLDKMADRIEHIGEK